VLPTQSPLAISFYGVRIAQMSDISELTQKINNFLRERNWEKHQKPKDLAISLCLEAAEVLEHFQWRNDKVARKQFEENREALEFELADVAIYLLKICDKLGVDLKDSVERKLLRQEKKYPVSLKNDSGLEKYWKIKSAHRK
jgi:NTP pyrophosphatase (non-canonical NTP hydrolase)